MFGCYICPPRKRAQVDPVPAACAVVEGENRNHHLEVEAEAVVAVEADRASWTFKLQLDLLASCIEIGLHRNFRIFLKLKLTT